MMTREHYLDRVTMTRESESRPNRVTMTRSQLLNRETGPCHRLGVTILSGLFQMPQKETIHYPTVTSNGTTLDAIKTQENGNEIRGSILIVLFME
jgi:hypothetical protein